MILTGPFAEDIRPEGFAHGVSYHGERFPDFDAFHDRATVVCQQVCVGRWVMDYFHVHLERPDDELLVALIL